MVFGFVTTSEAERMIIESSMELGAMIRDNSASMVELAKMNKQNVDLIASLHARLTEIEARDPVKEEV